MDIEYKAVGVTGVAGDAETDGRVTAIVAVTGIVDGVNDIIEPGALQKSLDRRIPKGVWHHNWHHMVSKTEEVKELMPGDPRLPATLPNGKPWPKEAGGLLVKMLFNLNTQRGRDAYEDVKFFKDQQEWSIGYQVPRGGATVDTKTGIRHIRDINLYEYSPVLFGAMPHARTTSVKDAQAAFTEIKALHGDAAETFLRQVRNIVGDAEFKGASRQEELTGEEPTEEQEDIEEGVELDDDGKPIERGEDWIPNQRKGEAVAMSQKQVRAAISALQDLLGEPEEKAARARREEEYDDLDDYDEPYDDEEDDEDDVPLTASEVEKKSLATLTDMAGLDVRAEARAFEFHLAEKSMEAATAAAGVVVKALEEAMADEPHHSLGAVALKVESLLSEMSDRIEGVVTDAPATVEAKSLPGSDGTVVVNVSDLLANL